MNSNIIEILQKKEMLGIVVNAISSTIAEYTKTKIESGSPQLSSGLKADDLAILGVIRYEGQNLSFELLLGLTLPLYQYLYSKIFNFETDEVNEDGRDLAGEILNIAFGKMDPILRAQSISLQSSLPIVYYGDQISKVASTVSGRCLVIPFSANGKKFDVKIYSGQSLNENWQFTAKAS